MAKEYCCCEFIHVRTGALIIGSLAFNFGIIGLLASVARSDTQSIVINTLSVIIGGCIVYADKFQKPEGYLPYLICVAIGIVVYTIAIVLFVIKPMAVPGTLSYYTQDFGYGTQHKDKLHFLFMALVYWIAIWLWMVVYRAYQHMCVEENDREQTY